MLKVLWNLVGRTGGVAEEVQPAGPAVFEPLEPRLLLSADLGVAQPLPSEFASTDYAIHVDLNQRDDLPQADVTPVLTLELEAGAETPDVCGQAEPAGTDSTIVPVVSQATGEQVEYGITASAEASGSPVLFPDEQAGPAVPDQQDFALGSESPSVEIRGPPSLSCDSVNAWHETTYGEERQVSPSAEVGGVSTPVGSVAPDLPSLQLVNPDISNWRGQIIYLDFDGAQNVTYNGPVTIGPFDRPAFSLEGTALVGQEGAIITEVVARLQEIFAGSGALFTTEQPQEGTPHSTIWIGGDDSAFSVYGSFLGLAEQVDAGNALLTDDALVFSGELLGTSAGVDDFADRLSRTIAHEAGHLLGYEHDASPAYRSTGGSALFQVALPEITVLGNSLSIADGDTTPDAADHTDFGSVVQGSPGISRTFTVRNDGPEVLTLWEVTVPMGYTLTEALTGNLATGGSDTFTVRLDTMLAGIVSGEISFANGDGDENPFNFRVTGTVLAPEATVLGNGISIADGDTSPSLADHRDFGSVVQGGDPITRTFTIRNDGVATLTLGTVTVPTGYTLAEPPFSNLGPGGSDTFTVQLDTTTAGTKAGNISFSTNDLEENPFNFRITGVVSLPQAEQFRGSDSFDLANKGVLFTPNVSGYTFTTRPITVLPTSPAGGTRLTLEDDDAVRVTLESGQAVILYRQSYGSFYVNSNGNITFAQADTSYWETPEYHYNAPRISVLYDDLDPESGGQIGWQQFSDRAVVTWAQVPDIDTGVGCTLQVTMYFDGRIELAWLAMGSPDGIVGLSNGSGLMTDFIETDFSRGVLGPPEIVVQGNGVSIANGDATPSAGDDTDFGAVMEGDIPVNRVFTVRNEGLSTLTLGTVTVPAGFMLWEPLATTLEPGATDTFTVRLDTAFAGTRTGEISFSTNDTDDNPFRFRITGTVLVPPEVTVLGNGVLIGNGQANPRSLDHTDFGSVVLDGTATYRTFTVRNDGGSTLTLGAVSVPTGFTLTEGLTASLEPGESDTFTVQLDTAPAGAKSGDLIFATNDADENPFQFQIAGLVVLVAAPEIGVLGNGTSIASGDTNPNGEDGTDFGTVNVGRPLTRTYTIENRGTALMILTGSPRVTISGSDDFSVLVQPGFSVIPGGSTTFQIRFSPSSAGAKTATVSIANTDGDENPYTFALQGAGVAWDFLFYDDFDDADFAGWSAVDPLTGAPTAAPDVVASPEGFALRGIGSGYGQDPALTAMLTRDLPTGNLGELRIEMRAKAGPDRPNAAQVQLLNGSEYYTGIDNAMDGWDPNDKADWNSWVDRIAQQYSYGIANPPGAWHDFAWVRDAEGQWSLFIDGQLKAAGFRMDNQLRSFTKVALSLLRNQSEIEWIAISGNTLPPGAVAVPVYRFWSPRISQHFYTASAREKDKLITEFPLSWTYEGIAFAAFRDGSQAGTVPLYRLWSPQDNAHYFTLDKGQRDKLLASPEKVWMSEGIAFYLYPVASHPAGTSAVYRFWSPTVSEYFFTMNTAERDHLRTAYPSSIWTYEDEAWYAFAV